MKHVALFLAASIQVSAFAWTSIKVKIVHPDNEEKAYSFLPTANQTIFPLKVGENQCLLEAISLPDAKKFSGVSISCMPSGKDTNQVFASRSTCDSGAVMRIDRTIKGKKSEATVIIASCD